ncbi:CUE domain-containing protein 1 [Condylostylus longicornis]|uniref:CUE domain-containing protein 1 n=1 Tax=Condylostylus longicornis TaxID=2530218 RepID=UPI00244DCA44|nr:CUE domain-containing protein 1 [Condylostylus longicornis]
MASTMQLEFSQAMSDFKTMFPEMDRDVIEAVLRANQGAVDATIDQLLTMSTDNQNERLRIELENSSDSPPSGNDMLINTADNTMGSNISENVETQLIDTTEQPKTLLSTSPLPSNLGTNLINTGASPKIKCNKSLTSPTGSPVNSARDTEGKRKWNPPLLSPLPPSFLRLNTISCDVLRSDFDLPDEQFAMMLQNEEFMNELRWNQEFMSALEKEQQGKSEGDMAFKDRVRHMGKVSRKKFLQVARVFTWQRNKKATSAKQIDSLPLKEEHSDDDDHHINVKK